MNRKRGSQAEKIAKRIPFYLVTNPYLKENLLKGKERIHTMQKKPRVFKAISTALLGLIVFGLIYFLTYLIAGGIIYVLSLIPIIGNLIDWLFQVRGDTPDMMLSILAPAVAYYGTLCMQSAINKDAPTRGLSCVILGVILVAIHALSLVSNLLTGGRILENITQSIAGFIIFKSGREDQEMSN